MVEPTLCSILVEFWPQLENDFQVGTWSTSCDILAETRPLLSPLCENIWGFIRTIGIENDFSRKDIHGKLPRSPIFLNEYDLRSAIAEMRPTKPRFYFCLRRSEKSSVTTRIRESLSAYWLVGTCFKFEWQMRIHCCKTWYPTLREQRWRPEQKERKHGFVTGLLGLLYLKNIYIDSRITNWLLFSLLSMKITACNPYMIFSFAGIWSPPMFWWPFTPGGQAAPRNFVLC